MTARQCVMIMNVPGLVPVRLVRLVAKRQLRVARSLSATEEYPLAQASRLASLFDLPAPLEVYDFPDKGNINQHTYLISAGRTGTAKDYLLQRINQQVFTQPRSVMSAMVACIQAQRESLAKGSLGDGEEWDIITLIPTRAGNLYLEVEDRRGYSCWRLMIRIQEARTYKSLSEIGDAGERLRVAQEAAGGLALYGNFTSGMNTASLASPLPGYRDTRLYYNQLLSVLEENRTLPQAEKYLPSDPVVRQSTQHHFLVHISPEEYARRLEDPELAPFVSLAREQETLALRLLQEMEAGRIRRMAIHGDTKLDNFLFSTRTGRVKAVVDLDTIMPHTWLADWGDMVRSLVNVAGEKEPDLSKVQVDMDVFRAAARGFLRSARGLLPREVGLMVEAVQIISLELGIRFLADYLRGDSYFKLGPADPPDLNRTRAMVQLTLFERLRAKSGEAGEYVRALSREYGSCLPDG